MTYSEAKAYLDEIAAKNTSAKGSLRTAKLGVTNVKSLLDAMPAQYGQVVTDINAAATANPDDKAWQVAAAEAAQLTADFGTLQSTAGDMVTALESFEV